MAQAYGHDVFRFLRIQYIQHRHLGLLVLHRQPQLPVARRQGAAVDTQIIGPDSKILPQLHGQKSVDYMAGAEKQHVIRPVPFQKPTIFASARRQLHRPAQIADAANNQGQQHQDADEALKTAHR